MFSTELDNTKLEKELTKVTREIETLEEKINSYETQKSPLVQEAEELRSKMKAARVEVENYRQAWVNGESGADQKQSAAAERLQTISQRYEEIVGKIDKIDSKLLPAHEKLESMKENAGGLAQRLEDASQNSSRMKQAADTAEEYLSRFTDKCKQLVKRIFVFSLISSALRSMKDYLWKVIKTNDEASQAIARLKGALLTLAQPIIEIIVPAFTALVNILTRIISVAAQLVSFLFGKTAIQSKDAAKGLYQETSALEGVGEAAEEAAGSLAGFDEINAINTETADGTADSAGSGDIAPDFSFDMVQLTEEQLKTILGWVELIGAGLLAWKIGNSLGLGLKETLGLVLGIYSSFQFLKALTDAWCNGVSWDSLLDMLLSLAGAAAGFGIAFGPVGAGIALLIGGLAMLVTGFHDAFENGWNFQNLMTSLAGILAAGLGISLLTGSWFPLLIAGIAAVLLALAVATGHGEELLDGVKLILEGFTDFFTGIFTGDMEKAIERLKKIFDGLKKVVDALIDGLKDGLILFLDWLDEKTNGKFSGVIDLVKNLVEGLCDSLKTILDGLILFVAGVFTGDWETAWEGVKVIFKGLWNGIVGILEAAINLIVKGVNLLIRQLNKISFTAPDWIPGVGGKSFGINLKEVSELTIPRLATGAVVPPNREFMAVLGDNKTETEIVSPLSTMKQAMLEALRESGGVGGDITITVVSQLDGREVARNTVKHVNTMTQQAGKSVLLV